MANYDRLDWLALRSEVALDPTRPIIEPHHHLWDRDGSRYLAAELSQDTGASHNVTHTVFVECSAGYDAAASDPSFAPVGETRFVAEQAAVAHGAGGPEIAGIVGHVDMMLGAQVAPVLQAHDQAGNGLFRGIRHGTNWSEHPDVKNGHHGPAAHQLLDPQFQSGVARLGEMGFSFDAWLYFDQLHELAELARVVPNCSIVVDHLGGPLGIGPHAADRTEMISVWRAGLSDVAHCPNVSLKIGGLGMEHYFGTPWAALPEPPASETVAAFWQDLVYAAIDTFGPSRCMFESNFPVDRQTLPYTVLWNAFEILASRYSATEQHQLFFATANDVYRLGADN